MVDFYSECKGAVIKPIIGCEVYVARGSRLNKDRADRSPIRLVLLARENEGYRNLIALGTQAHPEGFHYRPWMDKEILREHSGGLVCLSGCASGEIPRLILDGEACVGRESARNSGDRPLISPT